MKERVFTSGPPGQKGCYLNCSEQRRKSSGEFNKFLSGGCKHGIDGGGQGSAMSGEKILTLAGHFTDEAMIALDAIDVCIHSLTFLLHELCSARI